MATPRKPKPPDRLPSNEELKVMIKQRLGVPTEEAGRFREGYFYAPTDVCSRLGISQSTLLAWRKKYAIPFLKACRTTRYSGEVLNNFMASMEKRDSKQK